MLRSDGALATDGDSQHAETGELRLVAAVLERAVRDARRGSKRAARWLESDCVDGGEAGWTYVTVCELLELDPSWGRAQVAQGGRRSGRPAMRRTRRLRAAA